jgi:hypothetical protein
MRHMVPQILGVIFISLGLYYVMTNDEDDDSEWEWDSE